MSLEVPKEMEAGYVAHLSQLFEESQSAVDGLIAFRACLITGQPLTEAIKQFMLEGVCHTLEGQGKITMDKAFGITDAKGVRSDFTTSNSRSERDYSGWIIHTLVSGFKFNASEAARLLCERGRVDGKVEFDSESYRRWYGEDKKTMDPYSTSFSSEQAANEFIQRFLGSFNVPTLTSELREKLVSKMESMKAEEMG